MVRRKKFDKAIVVHKRCIDGAAAAVFAQTIFPGIESFYSNHIDINTTVLSTAKRMAPGSEFWIVDICCDQNVLEKVFGILMEKKVKLNIYEHHISRQWLHGIEGPQGLDFISVFNTGLCGSRLFYDAYIKEHPELKRFDEFSWLVNDRDLWDNTDSRGEMLTRLHSVYGDELFIERILENEELVLTEKEKILMEYQERKEEEYLLFLLETIKIKKDKKGFRYGIMYGNGMSSELLDRALNEKNLEYAMLVNLNAQRASIRSKGNFDCASYAMQRGGGGHECAAGFPVDFDLPVL